MSWDINEVAPNLAELGITETQAETFYDARVEPDAPTPVATYTKAQAASVANAYFTEGLPRKGLREWAERFGLKIRQVKEIVRDVRAVEAAIKASREV